MKTFLHHVASTLLQRYGTDMSRLTVVFPGKRAGLFLEQALAELSPSPVWAPRYLTISDLFCQLSPYSLCDSIEAVARLYRSYLRHVDDPWPLDSFYGWGEMLMSDFDDIDKHLVDAHVLFCNIADLRRMDDNSYIQPEQEEALRQFFEGFSLEANSELKQRFLRLWSSMEAIYDDLNMQMRAEGILYEGALQRDVAVRLRSEELRSSSSDIDGDFAFVGFNVLSTVEETLFDYLQRRGQALFFWDYDRYYVDQRNSQEAGTFVLRNLKRYGNALPQELFDNLSKPPRLNIIAATSENAQARYITSWLKTIHDDDALPRPRENQTAIVLANEQLLPAVLHSIPTPGEAHAPKAVNITMGYPLVSTAVYSLVDALLSLQTEGYDTARHRFRMTYLRAVRSHPFARLVPESTLFRHVSADDGEASLAGLHLVDYILDILTAIPHSPLAPDALSTLNLEAIFQAYTAILRLRDLAAATDGEPLLPVGPTTMRRLVRSVLQSRSIPFHGEPATGLQVMGLLETRALDFCHVAILSAGEGYLPRTSSSTSLIPYNLREAFGLTTLRHNVAVYAYNFYRLLQRAQSVTILYNESNTGLRQNEMSRFVRQIMAETDITLNHYRLDATGEPRDEDVADDVLPADASAPTPSLSLSPSAINTYTACPRRYYFQYRCGMRIDPDPLDGLDAILFGLVFHRAAELLYRQLTSRGPLVRAQDIDPYLEQGGQRLEPFVRQAFCDAFFSQARNAQGVVVGMPEEYTGILLIARDVVRTYLMQLLRNDRRLESLRVLALEEKHYTRLSIDIEGGDGVPAQTVEISTGGIIDRIDEVTRPDGSTMLRVVDYKTGGKAERVASLDSLFADTRQEEQHAFQTILYATILARESGKAVAPCLFYVHRSGSSDYSPHINLAGQQLLDVNAVADDFKDRLKHLLGEMLNPANTFPRTTVETNCRYCHFRRLCDK